MENVTQNPAMSDTLKTEEKKEKKSKPAKTGKKKSIKLKTAKPAGSAEKEKIVGKEAPKVKPKAVAKPKKTEKKAPKGKVVRDSFTMPESEYKALAIIKKKCIAAGLDVKKSNLLRVGLMSLSEMSIANLKKQLSKLATIKMGRPPEKTK